MQSHKVTFYVYADSEMEARELERLLYEFVDSKRQCGIAVTAQKLTQALHKFKNNYFVNAYLK